MYFVQIEPCTLSQSYRLYTKIYFIDYDKENERGRARWYLDFFVYQKGEIKKIILWVLHRCYKVVTFDFSGKKSAVVGIPFLDDKKLNYLDKF